MLLNLEIALVEEKNAARGMSVASGASRLRGIALERCRGLVVDDVVADRLGRGRGEGEDLAGVEARQPLTERQVGRPEVVAPLRDAVRLVDRDQARRLLLEESAELRSRERLGRRQDEERATL